MSRLTEAQIVEVQSEMVKDWRTVKPVRFLLNGQNVNLSTGELQRKGCNILHQMVYWNFTQATALKIANWLQAKAVFSD